MGEGEGEREREKGVRGDGRREQLGNGELEWTGADRGDFKDDRRRTRNGDHPEQPEQS